MSTDSTAERLGLKVGQGLRAASEYARKSDLKGKAQTCLRKVGDCYEDATHRDAGADGRTLGIVGAAGAAVLVGGAVIGTASALIVPGALALAGAAACATYYKHQGHDQEYKTVVGGVATAAKTVMQGGRDFVKGVQEGRSGGAS